MIITLNSKTKKTINKKLKNVIQTQIKLIDLFILYINSSKILFVIKQIVVGGDYWSVAWTCRGRKSMEQLEAIVRRHPCAAWVVIYFCH